MLAPPFFIAFFGFYLALAAYIAVRLIRGPYRDRRNQSLFGNQARADENSSTQCQFWSAQSCAATGKLGNERETDEEEKVA